MNEIKTVLFFFGFIFLLNSCNIKSSSPKTDKENVKPDTLFVFSHGDTLNPVPILSGDLENTLAMYSGKDSFEVFYGDWFLKIFLLNKEKFGIIADSLFRIYKLSNGNLQLLSKEKGGMRLQHFVITDITADGNNDAVIYDDFGGVNYDTKVLVFNAATKTLARKKYLDLENLEVDEKTGMLKTWHIPHSFYGGYLKAFYRNTIDSILLVKEIYYYSKVDSNGRIEYDVLRTSVITNGTLVRDSITTTNDKAFHIFNNELWDTNNEFEKKIFANNH